MKPFFASRYVLWLLLAVPFLALVAAFAEGRIFYGEMLHASGEFSVRLLIVTMAASTLRLLFPARRWSAWLLANRRYFGVASFMYAALHTLVYLDKQDSLATIAQDAMLFEMWTGWLAFVIFLALALTSNDAAMRRLRRTWKKLHRLVYFAALLTFTHWIFSAFNFVPAIVHLALLLAIESVRVIKLRGNSEI